VGIDHDVLYKIVEDWRGEDPESSLGLVPNPGRAVVIGVPHQAAAWNSNERLTFR
jgi:hypothetical protein